MNGVLETFDATIPYFELDKAFEADMVKASGLVDELEIEGVPTILFVVNGVVVDRLNGLRPKEQVIEFFEINGGF